MDLSVDTLFEILTRAWQSGNWMYVLAAALVAITWLVRKYLAPKVPFLSSDAGGVVLAFALAFFGALATALGAGSALSATLFLAAAKIAFSAIGGYSVLKKLLWPFLSKVLGMKATSGTADAVKAGVEAVQAKPAAGAAAVAGKPTEVK